MLLLRYKTISLGFILLSLGYIGLSILAPQDAHSLAKYHLTSGHARLLGVTVILPYVVIWLIALVGYLRLRRYSDTINGGKEGEAFKGITQGMALLTFWLPISGVCSSVFSAIYIKHPAATASLTIINTYINLVVLFAAFLLLDKGAKKFASVTRSIKNAPSQGLIMVYLVFATLYTWLVLSDSVRRVPTSNAPLATYYEPDWLIVTSVIIPRLIMWFLAAMAVQNIYYYHKKVKGQIYKRALNRLAIGLGWTISSIISLRCLQSLSPQLSRLGLAGVLLLIYCLLIFIGIGYGILASGAKKLQKIEEI